MSTKTLEQNVHQAYSDFSNIKTAIANKGADIPDGTPTSDYAEKINSIQTGITPTGSITIAQNGSYDVTEFATADIDVKNDDSKLLMDLYTRKIQSITIPEGVTKIGNYAFRDCSELTNVTLPSTLKTIGVESFSNCRGLLSIEIPEGVTRIDVSAFVNSGIRSITIPTSVSYLGMNALTILPLTSVVIMAPLTTLVYGMFSCCEQLTSVVLPETLERIEEYTFSWCTALPSIAIPKNVTEICEGAFNTCPSLTDVYYPGTEEEWNAITIGNDNDALINATKHFNYVE